jgi:hypothetical protein
MSLDSINPSKRLGMKLPFVQSLTIRCLLNHNSQTPRVDIPTG